MLVPPMNKEWLWIKYTLPTLVCLVSVLMNATLFHTALFMNVPIAPVWIIIFYFAVFHPAVLNVIAVFCIGLFTDLITEGPFGIHTFSFVLLFFAANLNRRFCLMLKFSDLWAVFGLVLFGVRSVEYLLCALAMMMWPPLEVFVFQYIVLMLAYPAVSWGCGWLNMKIGSLS